MEQKNTIYHTITTVYEYNGYTHEMYAEYNTKEGLIKELNKIQDFYINKLHGEGYFNVTILG